MFFQQEPVQRPVPEWPVRDPETPAPQPGEFPFRNPDPDAVPESPPLEPGGPPEIPLPPTAPRPRF